MTDKGLIILTAKGSYKQISKINKPVLGKIHKLEQAIGEEQDVRFLNSSSALIIRN